MLMLVGLSAKAQDFTATVTWSEPGAIEIVKYPYPDNIPVEIPADATSFTITETGLEYIFKAAPGYMLTAAMMDGQAQALGTLSYDDPAKVFRMNLKYTSGKTKYNGKTVELEVVKEVFDKSFTLDINNGADKINAYLCDDNGSKTHVFNYTDGVQTIEYTSADTRLFLQNNSYPRTAFYEVTVNGVPVECNATTKAYNIDLVDGATIYVAYMDPATVEPKCKVTFEFTNNDPACLSNIRDWAAGKFIFPNELVEGYELLIEKGGQIQFNFNEDYTVNDVTANGTSIGEPFGGRRLTVEADTKYVIDATANVYPSLTAKLYTNNIDALILTQEYSTDSEALTVTEVADCPAGTVTLPSGYTIAIATKEYEISDISGKTKKFFFNPKPGYWVKGGQLGNPSDPDNADLFGKALIFQEEAPAFINVGTIDYTAAAAVFVDAPANSARLKSYYSPGGDAKEAAPYQGEKEFFAPGWSDITFDPAYNTNFDGTLIVASAYAAYEKYVYLNGEAVTADENGVYSNMKFKENSVLKMFLTQTPPAAHTLKFEVSGNPEASLSYDRIVTTTDFSAPIVNYGTVEYTLTVGEGTAVEVNGQAVALTDGKYVFTPAAGTTTIALLKTMPCVLEPAAGTTVRSLDSFSALFRFEDPGEVSIYMDEDAIAKVTISDGVTTYLPAYVEGGEPTDEAIPMTFYMAEPITEGGTYSINVPAGVFYQTFYDEASGDFVRTAESAVNAAASTTVVVDPNMVYAWTCTPANGSVNDLPDDVCVIKISLPDAKSLCEDVFTEGTGVYVKYNGNDIRKVEDPESEEGWAFGMVWGQPALNIYISKDVFRTAGILTIEAPEGAMTVDYTEASPELLYSAQFGEIKEYTWTFDPAEGTEIESVGSFKLTFPEAETVVYNEDMAYFVFGNMSGAIMNFDVTCEGNTATITPIIGTTLRPGTYTLTVGEESFILDGNQNSPEINASWTLKRNAEVSYDFQASPDGTILNEGWGLNVAFIYNETESVRAGDNFDATLVKFNDITIPLWNSDMEDGATAYRPEYDPSTPNLIMINASGNELNDVEGSFTVTFPAGALNISGTPNPEPITYTWNVVLPKEYNITLSPASGTTVPEIKTITITFGNATTAELGEYYSPWSITLRKTDYSASYNPESVEPVADAAVPAFLITFAQPVKENGDYKLSISYGTFVLDGVQVTENIDATYVIDPTSGIDGIFAGADKVTVCNLKGMVILENADAADVKALPAGFYIINGVKVAIK